jgi:uncharacterized membrane protein
LEFQGDVIGEQPPERGGEIPRPSLLEGEAMKQVREFVTSSVLSGLLLAVPLYLAVLLLLKATGSVVHLVQPIAQLLPRWSHAEDVLALLIVLFLCFLIGVALRTASGKAVGGRIEGSVLVRIPGYLLLRSLTKQLAGESEESAWKPALVEIEDALVPAFIIEEFEDGRYTIFVPSSPSPFTGAVYILGRERVHLLDASLAQTIQAVSRWGSGSRDLVAAMKPSTRRAAG